MDSLRKSCCARAAGWAAVGIAVASAWGFGNLASGMAPLEAFAIPTAIIAVAVGVVALALLNVRWFNRLCACPGPRDPRSGTSIDARRPSAG